MKIYKERQFLVFEFPDGKTVKYDFATKETIGKKGKPVKNLCSQLSGLTMKDVIENCTDKNYSKFLRFVLDEYNYKYGVNVKNIGTVLDKVPLYARYEQIFSAGIDDIIGGKFDYTINDIPKGIIKLCRTHNIKLSNNFLKFYKENPDGYLYVYNQKYESLDDDDIYRILMYSKRLKVNYGSGRWDYSWVECSIFNELTKKYGYTVKGLVSYIDYLKTYEAIDETDSILNELYDYASMMKELSNKFDKYPRHFLTTHRIACRNYSRLKKEFEEDKFKARICLDMEKTFGDYTFIYPKCIQDIRDEAVSQSNCVASYIDKVINGTCDILFLRYKDSPDKSLVTIEVRNDRIVQARQRFNYKVTEEQQEAIDKWNKYWSNKINKNKDKENESEETNYVN